jgi:hypothetical protein
MRAPRLVNRILLFVAAYVAACALLPAQSAPEVVTGQAFDSAIVRDFYLEGTAIPVEKRNAALLKTARGARAEIALLDTSGYSSQAQQKYSGMIISEGELSAGGVKLGVGSFGFGTSMPHPPSNADARVFFYDQAGNKIGECTARKDISLKSPRPLQVVVSGGHASLYLGIYRLELR